MTMTASHKTFLPWRRAVGVGLLMIAAHGLAVELPLALQGQGPYFRLALPAQVLPYSRHADLRDLQVLNGAGVPVPFAWLPEELASPQVASRRVPVFALPPEPGGQETSSATLGLRVGPDGQIQVAVVNGAKTPSGATRDWLLDTSAVQGSMAQLRLSLPQGVTGLFPFTLQASEDLQSWRTMTTQGTLLRLRSEGTQIERLSVDLHGARARYLRLKFQSTGAPPQLAGAQVDNLQKVDVVPALQWSEALRATHCEPRYCEYVLPANTPIDALRISLAQANTLVPVTVSGSRPPASAAAPRFGHRNPLYVLRHKRETPPPASDVNHHWLAHTVAYRLATTRDGVADEALSPELPMNGGVYTALRLTFASPVDRLGAAPPSIAIGSYPRSLVFLAQGGPPFRLAWSSDSPSALLPISTLVPRYRSGQAIAIDAALVQLPAQVAAQASAKSDPPSQPSEVRTRPVWLWVTLGLALVLLSGMAWSLFRSMRKPDASP